MTVSHTPAQHKSHMQSSPGTCRAPCFPSQLRAFVCVACAAISGTSLTTCGRLQGTLFPMCGMNLAFDRQLIGPAMYFGLMGDGQPIGRYDDMWAGWCCKVGALQLLLLLAFFGAPAFRICRCCGCICCTVCQGAVYPGSCPWPASLCRLLLRATWWAAAALCPASGQTMRLASNLCVAFPAAAISGIHWQVGRPADWGPCTKGVALITHSSLTL